MKRIIDSPDRFVLERLEGISVYRSDGDEFAASMEMAGASVSLLMLDEELKGFLDAQADTPFFKQFGF